MKIIRYHDSQGQAHYGEQHTSGAITQLEGCLGQFTATDIPARVSKRLAPVSPPAIYCIGMNYKAHAEETGKAIPSKPLVFMKAPTTVQDPAGPVVLPRHLRSDEVDYEAELAVVIGKACKNATLDNALDFVAGYTCANDISARDWQIKWGQGQFVRGKTFDTFCPLGPALVTPDEVGDPHKLSISQTLNGETVQDATTEELIFSIPELIVFLSGSTTLAPGTVILTGTPAGVGIGRTPSLFLKPGDELAVSIQGIGTLKNHVIEEQ